MTVTFLVLIAFLLGVFLARPIVAWAVLQALIANLRLMTRVHDLEWQEARRQREQALADREPEALERAQLDLASQVGSRRWP